MSTNMADTSLLVSCLYRGVLIILFLHLPIFFQDKLNAHRMRHVLQSDQLKKLKFIIGFREDIEDRTL